MNSSRHAAEILCPYPGLRPFHREESQFFFGREEHIDELLSKLESNRFVAVIGASGCGKSSLVRAGLLPMLENGFMAEAGPHWRMATMRPGNAPFEHLTQALLEEAALGPERSESPQSNAILEATLRRGRFGLVDALQETLLPEGTNLLVLVDQFEEIFRYREQSSVNEAEAFVELILAAAQHHRDPRQKRRDAPVYVLLTMRSDFIGDCALFLGLPEAINASQFLTPRLNRDQCRAAIVGPARALGGEVEPLLVNHLLNNLRADADHLPLLQHVLMRMWRTAAVRNLGVAPSLRLADLEATGGMEHALSSHADEAFQQLSQPQQRIAECMFRSLCELGADGRAIRRLIRLEEVAAIAETTCEQVYPVVKAFRHPDRSFLMPPSGVPIKEETVLDISHESLIRQWKRLADWTVDEAASAHTYRRLRQTARLWKKDEAALWRTPDLEIAEVWRDKQKPNSAWASRYGGELDVSNEFLNASIGARTRSQRIKRWGAIGAFAALLAVAAFMTFATVVALAQKGRAEQQSDIATKQTAIAEEQTKRAEEQKQLAEVQADRAEKQSILAQNQKVLAEQQADRATRSSYNVAFTGILDQWRLATDREKKDAFKARVDNEETFPLENQEFAWRFCKSLTELETFDLTIIETQGRPVNSLSYLWNDNELLFGTESGQIHVWNMADAGASTDSVWEHPEKKPILAVCASPPTRLVALACDDGKIGIFDLNSRRLLHSLGQTGKRVRTLEFSPDGTILAAAGDDNNVSLWSVPSGERLKTFAGHTNWITSVRFSPDGQAIASGSYDTSIRIWDIRADEPPIILRDHEAPVLSIAFAPDGNRLASGSDDRTIKLWDIRAVKSRATVAGHGASVNALAFTPNGELLVSADDEGELRMWTVEDYIVRERVAPQRRHRSAIHAIAFSPTGKTLATGSSDSTIVLWDANFGLRLDLQRAECQIPTAKYVTFTTDSTTFAAISQESAVGPRGYRSVLSLWKKGSDGRFARNAHESKALSTIADATSICFRPQSETLAIGCNDGSVCLWDTAGTKPAKPKDAHDSRVLALAVDWSGQLLASGDEQGGINLWRIDGSGPQRALTWKRHTAAVRSLAFAPEIASQKWLASASEDGTVRIWNVDAMLGIGNERLPNVTAEYEVVLDDHEDWVGAVAFSPDRPILASAGDDGTIRQSEWDGWSFTSAPQRKKVMTGHLGAVTALAFSQDGKTLATGGVDKTVRLWDPLEGHLRLTLPGHLAAVRSVAFLSTSDTSHPRALASLSEDGALKFWMAAETSNNESQSDDQKPLVKNVPRRQR